MFFGTPCTYSRFKLINITLNCWFKIYLRWWKLVEWPSPIQLILSQLPTPNSQLPTPRPTEILQNWPEFFHWAFLWHRQIIDLIYFIYDSIRNWKLMHIPFIPLLRENMVAKKSAPKENSIHRDYYDLFKENPYTTEEVVKVCLWSHRDYYDLFKENPHTAEEVLNICL